MAPSTAVILFQSSPASMYFPRSLPLPSPTRRCAEIASSGKRDIDLALDAAHNAKDKWGYTSIQDRAAILFKIADRMEQNLNCWRR